MISKKTNKSIAYQFFYFDTYFNWFLGILFIFFHRQFETLISPGTVLPELIWIIMGGGLLAFGIWQTFIVIKHRFGKGSQLFSSILAWLPFLALSYALIFMNFDLFMPARILIWTGNLYMFTLGLLYFIAYRRPGKV